MKAISIVLCIFQPKKSMKMIHNMYITFQMEQGKPAEVFYFLGK